MLVKNRNLFRLTRFILLKLPLLFRYFARFRKPKKRLLIIKTDAIGDYILFRNFIELTKLSDTYKDYKIDVLGNVLWRDIALKYDKAYVDEFIFIKANLLYDAPLQTLKLGWQLFTNNYEVTLQPTYTRTFINDGLAGLTAANQIIGFEGDNESIAERYKTKTNKFYTRRLLLTENAYFEFERSKFFFEDVLNQHLSINATSIVTTISEVKQRIVIVPSAGILKRCWEAEKFLELMKRILRHTSHTIYLEGGPSTIIFADYLKDEIASKRVVDLTGKTTLPEMIELIGSAALLIANETSAIHIAVAAKTQSVCIMGGGHFKRFSPYPEYFESKPVCVYKKMDCYYCNWNCIYKVAENEPYPCIGNISVDNVWQAVLPLLLQ
jgi:ADP-heptose:LPS heptosyltransferase